MGGGAYYEWNAACEAALACLTGLSALELSFGDLPRSISALTALQCLSLEDAPNTNTALGAALRQLTCLMLRGWNALETQVVEMAGLPRLQHLWVTSEQEEEEEESACQPLPPGPWQRSLRWLAADWRMLSVNRQCVEGCGAMERLHIAGHHEHSAEGRRCTVWALSEANLTHAGGVWFARWAVRHPTLRQVSFERTVEAYTAQRKVLDALLDLGDASGGRMELLGVGTIEHWAQLEQAMAGHWRQVFAAWQGEV